MEQTINERLTSLICKLKKDGRIYNESDLAKRMNIGQPFLSDMKKGAKTISEETVLKLSFLFPEINVDWLRTGKGFMLLDDADLSKKDCDNIESDFTRKEISEKYPEDVKPRIPSAVAAGFPGGFAAAVLGYQCEQRPVIKSFPQYNYTIIVKGDSMYPKFEGGDEIAIAKVLDVVEWGKTYVLDTREGAVLKRLYDAGDSFRCVSYNPEYPDFSILKSDVFGVYRVVGLIRIDP